MTDGARRVKVEVLRYAFETLALEQVTAEAAARNFASLRILRSSASNISRASSMRPTASAASVCARRRHRIGTVGEQPMQDCEVLSSANSLWCLGPQRGLRRNVRLLMTSSYKLTVCLRPRSRRSTRRHQASPIGATCAFRQSAQTARFHLSRRRRWRLLKNRRFLAGTFGVRTQA